jgi:hypothetical protein
MAKAATKEEEKTPPVYKNQLNAMQIAVWSNTHQVEGEDRTFYTITLERSYRDKDDVWHKTKQLRERDIGDTIALLQSAQSYLMSGNVA